MTASEEGEAERRMGDGANCHRSAAKASLGQGRLRALLGAPRDSRSSSRNSSACARTQGSRRKAPPACHRLC